MAVDGSITIGIGANTDEFDKKIADLEKKMSKEEDKKIEYEAEINLKEGQIQKAKEILEKMQTETNRVNAEMQDLATQMDSLKIDTPEFEVAQQKLTELQIEAKVYQELWNRLPEEIEKQEIKVENLKNKQQEINDKVAEYKQKIESIKLEQQVAEVDRMKQSFNNVGSSIQNSIRSVARLALGVLSVAGAYSALKRASSDLASYDKQYAANIEYIRYALTQAIAPVLRWIVQMAATLLGYINAILNGWFGINLFSRGSAENFNKMKASTGGISKAVKEIKKQLAGFDEINMLTDQSDTGTKAGAGGIATPDFDLSGLQEDVPPWLQWIIDNRDLILSILGGILGFIIGIKVGLDGFQALGLGALIGGTLYAVEQLLEYLKDPSWENFGGILEGVGVAIIGLGALIGSVPVAVAGAIVLIIGIITKYWEQIKSFFQGGIDWLTGKSEWVHQMFGDVIGNIYDLFTRTLQNLLDIFDSFFKMLKGVFDGIIKFIKGVFTGNWKQAWEGIKDIFKSIWNGIKDIFKGVIKIIGDMTVTVAKTTGKIISNAFKAVVNGVMWAIETVLNSPIRAINGLISVINAVPGINLGHLSEFNLPRLAVGGIVNMPNRGTMVGGAITGESGREGVLPLTDQQTMAELGREIGRHVLVNLTNITQMNGRVIGRELKQVQSEQEFAFNS